MLKDDDFDKFFASTPKLKQKVKEAKAVKIKFDEIPLGYSTSVGIDDVNERSLRTIASKEGKRLGRRFVVVKHSDQNIFEIGRVE